MLDRKLEEAKIETDPVLALAEASTSHNKLGH